MVFDVTEDEDDPFSDERVGDDPLDDRSNLGEASVDGTRMSSIELFRLTRFMFVGVTEE